MSGRNSWLYGIGHAIVDIFARVEDDFLSSQRLSKGHMHLVDAKEQSRLLSLSGKAVISRQSGGSVANTLVLYSHFGGEASYACRIGADDCGDIFLHDLRVSRVAVSPSISRAKGVTGTCLVLLSPDGERTMCTNLGVSGDFSLDDVDVNLLKAAKVLYIEGYILSSAKGMEAALYAQSVARSRGILVSLSLSDPSIVKQAGARINELLVGGVDLLFCNEAEALLYTGAADFSSAASLLGSQVDKVLMTRGKEGVLLLFSQRLHNISARHVSHVLDTTGAGDMFAAAFLYAYSQGREEVMSASFACQAASHLVEYLGGRLPKSSCEGIWRDFVSSHDG